MRRFVTKSADSSHGLSRAWPAPVVHTAAPVALPTGALKMLHTPRAAIHNTVASVLRLYTIFLGVALNTGLYAQHFIAVIALHFLLYPLNPDFAIIWGLQILLASGL